MKIFRLVVVLILAGSVSACGVDKFFIERAVNKVDSDIVNHLEDFATLTEAQEAQATAIAESVQLLVKQNTLPKVSELIELVAQDIEADGVLQQSTYDTVVAFFYRPFPLSNNDPLLSEVARFFYEMSSEQDIEVREKLQADYIERKENRDDRDLEKQKDGIAKTLKTIFKGMDVGRSSDQIDEMRAILDARIDLGKETEEHNIKVNQAFITLTKDKGDSLSAFTERYAEAWQMLEDGANSAHPDEFKRNADNGFEAINYLFASLDGEERMRAANVIREYETFFLELATAE
ncbi:MAG: hypothetical protein P8I38_00210 [Arenicella sp.]|jgi:hypothetical protein|nr:hypothetical protein [Arenicella sp.]